MNVHNMIDIAKQQKNHKAMWEKIYKKQMENNKKFFAKFGDTIRRLSHFYDATIDVESDAIEVAIEVKDLKELMPLFAFIESEHSVTFDKSYDLAEYGWRTYTAKDCWLKVRGNVGTNSEKCKRVLTGYQQVPTYKLECEE